MLDSGNMEYNEMQKIIETLEFDKPKTVCIDESGAEIYIYRPSEIKSKLKNEYDTQKNFQIWLNYDFKKFRPNHLRVLIDLNLRVRARPESKKELMIAFDNIFYGKDPDLEISKLSDIDYPYSLNSIRIIANLSQLFIIEQETNYSRESYFKPKALFYQGWVREFIDCPKEVEQMCFSAAKGQQPLVRYTNKENKKLPSKYEPNLKQLWYIE